MKANQWIEKPPFLVGSVRSGTTMLRLMLDSHPELAWSSEFEYAVDYMHQPDRWPQLETFYEALETDRIFKAHRYSIDPNLDYPHLIGSFLEQKRQRAKKPFVGATVHRHFDRLLRIWPDARFIHIIRDPRDVASSCVRLSWAGNTWTGIDIWIEAEQTWEKIRTEIPAERYFEVQYETLVTQPEATLAQICEFIGIAYSSEMLSYSEKTTYSAPDPKQLYKWRRKLDEKSIQYIESKASKLLVKRGYELSGLPLLSLSPWQKRLLEFQARWQRLRLRIARYGFGLVLADYLSRKLGLKQWHKQVKFEFNELVQARLK